MASRLAILATGLAIAAPAAKATIVYNDGDLLIGFRSSTSNFDYVVDLGPDANFLPSGAQGFGTGTYVTGSKITLFTGSQLAADLSAAGLTSGTFGIFGGDNSFTTYTAIFGTKVESTPGVAGTPQVGPSSSAIGTPYSNLSGMGGQAGLGVDQLHGANPNQTLGVLSNSVIQHIASDANPNVAPNNYSSFYSPLPAFGFFDTPAEGNYASGSGSDVLSLYEFDGGPSPTNGTLLGGFQLAANGDLTFSSNVTSYAATPEPTTMVALLAGGLVVGSMRRRRTAVAK